ncbi:large ribosomal subunit protein mL63 [Halyomorpha halys]|uniref:large ribosomal subunit protein mL63 n=1 Tax=Halyomorpha halys TaxID=286706 RepID=UPI0006D5146E|nr:ribosomal protein 63, mitochondrial [Halyomorpha halys]
MRLTLSLFLFKLPNGNIFSGKHRLVKPVTKKAVALLQRDLAVEEENMFYLRHPFLTREQSKGHSKHLQKASTRLEQFRIARNEKFAKHKTLKNELSHLKVKEQWEFTAGS